MQLHRRFAAGRRSEEFVDISRARIAESRVESVDDAPCIDCPPVSVTFVFKTFLGAGEAFLELFWEALREEEEDLVLNSDIKEPAAEGGGRATGACTAAGFEDKEAALLGVPVRDGLCVI